MLLAFSAGKEKSADQSCSVQGTGVRLWMRALLLKARPLASSSFLITWEFAKPVALPQTYSVSSPYMISLHLTVWEALFHTRGSQPQHY